MSNALAVYHGQFGRAALYQLDREMATHAHREGHLTYYVGGLNSAMRIDDVHHDLNTGLAAAVNPWQAHSFIPGDLEHGSVFLVLYIRQGWFRHMACSTNQSFRFGQSVIEVSETIGTLVKRITELLLTEVYSDLFDGYLYELTQESFDQSWRPFSENDAVPKSSNSFTDFRIRNALKLMKSQIAEGEGFLFDRIARDAGLSRPHFFKLFRENVGLTPNIYMNTLRMESAIDALTTSDEAVTNIGLDLGFASQASFSRFFLSNVGIPPSDYRKVAKFSNA